MNKPSLDEFYFEVTEKKHELWSWLIYFIPGLGHLSVLFFAYQKKYLLVEGIEIDVWYMLHLSFSKSFLVSLDDIFSDSMW